MTLGPFFPREFACGANDPRRRRAGARPIEITGRVVQADGRALDSVVLEIWQADAEGRYRQSCVRRLGPRRRANR
jgi:protocatechuate 3,4-dioxygenase beta subunit